MSLGVPPPEEDGREIRAFQADLNADAQGFAELHRYHETELDDDPNADSEDRDLGLGGRIRRGFRRIGAHLSPRG